MCVLSLSEECSYTIKKEKHFREQQADKVWEKQFNSLPPEDKRGAGERRATRMKMRKVAEFMDFTRFKTSASGKCFRMQFSTSSSLLEN